jgi:hypothetical protein
MKTELKTKKVENTIDDNLQLELSIIPVSSNKIPFKPWAEYQKKTAPILEWHTHFCNQGTVGIITGEVSGNLEIIDIDLKNDPLGTIMDEYIKLIPPDLYSRLIIQTTPNKGFHLIYSCPFIKIERNQKLALHTDKSTIIETRGEGGYFCTSKINNKVLQGVLDLEHLDINIPVITKDERELLLETARSLTRYFHLITESLSKNDKQFVYNEPAINEFNDKFPILELFVKHGWSVVCEDDVKLYLLRNGSLASHSGYYFKGSKVFFCFSSSTEFKPEKPYNHFQVLQALEGSNDYNKSIRLLPEYGFSTTDKKDKVTTDDIADYLNSIGIRFDAFIQDLTLNGKVIEEKDYNTAFINLKKHFEKEIPRSRFEETIKSNYITTINPIEDFISTNSHRNPSGTFEQWLDCIVLQNKSVDKSILLHFLKKWYVGMIAQALGAEYPNEFFLTLLSVEQGVGKTTFLRNYTLPKELHNYRVEHALSFDDDFKVIMGQALLIIDDEMDGRSYEADKTFKTVLSTKELTTRRKYDRRISTIKRRCSFAGSGNNLNVVREQQNRRIIPIEIEKMHFDKLAQIDYTDLFMEAYNLYENGFKYSYQREDINLLKNIYNDYVQKSDVDLILDEYILKPELNDVYYISSLDLVTCLANQFPYFSKRINVVAIGKLMNDRGLKTVRKGANKTTGYEISKDSRVVQLMTEDDNIICLG